MRTFPRYSHLVIFAAAVLGAEILLGLTGWPQPHRILEFSGVTLAAILTSALAIRPETADDRGIMPPSFVVDFSALLLFGANAALFVATTGAITRWLADRERSRPVRRTLLNAVIVMIATQAAGLAHQALGGVTANYVWPWQGVPIAAAVVAYCLVKSTSAEVLMPLLNRKAVKRLWPKAILRYSNYFIGAGLAVGLAEIVDHGMWEVLPVAAVPLY